MQQHGGEFRRIDAVMAELNEAYGAISARIQIGRKSSQDFVGVLIAVVNQRGQIALGVKHDASTVWLRAAAQRRLPYIPLYIT
jgi:hypothetical protein